MLYLIYNSTRTNDQQSCCLSLFIFCREMPRELLTLLRKLEIVLLITFEFRLWSLADGKTNSAFSCVSSSMIIKMSK